MIKIRVDKFLKNMKITLIFYIINMILMFISRSIFIKSLGPDITGVNSLFTSLIGFLNVAELGIGTAVGYSLYKPLKDRNFDKVNDIMVIFKHYYKNIARIILGLGIFLSMFLPLLIKGQIDLREAYIYYFIYLANCVLSYLLTYKQTLIIADQKQYKITTQLNLTKVFKIVIQCITLYYIPNFFVWLVFEIIFNLLGMIIANRTIDLEYKMINYDETRDIKILKLENQQIGENIKNIFFHKIGGFVVFQTDAIVISIFSTLRETAIYSNYIMIINSLTGLLSNVIGSMMPSVGNLIAEGDINKSYKIFRQLYLADHILAIFISTITYKIIDEFIIFWVGSEYLFSKYILITLMINLYIQLSRGTKDRFKDGFGIYWDIYAPIVESTVNIIFSIILAYKIGIIGVFIGTIISNLLIIEIWKPYILYKEGFKKSIKLYTIQTIDIYIRNLIVFIISNTLYDKVIYYFSINNLFIDIILHAVLIGLILLVLIFIIFGRLNEFKSLFKILRNIILKNLEKRIKKVY